jgi:hypothetical protein
MARHAAELPAVSCAVSELVSARRSGQLVAALMRISRIEGKRARKRTSPTESNYSGGMIMLGAIAAT